MVKADVSADPDLLLAPAAWEVTTIYYWYDYWYWWYGGYYPGWGWGGYYPPVYWSSYTFRAYSNSRQLKKPCRLLHFVSSVRVVVKYLDSAKDYRRTGRIEKKHTFVH